MQVRIFKEPTFYFLLLAALISLASWLINGNSTRELVIDRRDIDARVLLAELQQGAPVTEIQRQQIEDALIEEYILVQEAYVMGLENDARINDILAQKMRHVLSGNISPPDDAQLQAYFEANSAMYREPARITVEELVFNSPEPLPEVVQAQLDQGRQATNIESDLNRIAGTLPLVTRVDLASIFNPEIAEKAFDAALGSWVGPYISNRGQHWLRLRQRFPASVPDFASISDSVRADWIAAEEERLLAIEISQLREKYAVDINSSE